MSARAHLFDRLVGDAGLSTHWANRQIDAFAHELAEKIRDERPQWGDAWRHYGEAADLIDPAVTARNAEGNPA